MGAGLGQIFSSKLMPVENSSTQQTQIFLFKKFPLHFEEGKSDLFFIFVLSMYYSRIYRIPEILGVHDKFWG